MENENNQGNLNVRATNAAMRFLAMQDNDDVEEFEGVIKFKDGKTLVFCNVQVRASGEALPQELVNREEMERIAVKYLAAHAEAADCGVRFDNISMMVVGPDRALLRHHLNVLGENEEGLL